jgi:membrane associated rhomboid family serine protease
MPVEFDELEEQRRTVGHMAAFSRHHLRQSLAFSKSARGCSTFRIDSSSGDAARRLTFVTSFFLHAGIIHLAGNMYFLLAFGHAVENFLRPLRYLALIALAAFIGDLAHIALDPRSQTPCIGASGGIAGVITFYALNFPRMRLAF